MGIQGASERETDRQADSKCKERLTTIFYKYQNGETIVFSYIREKESYFPDPAPLHTDHINMHLVTVERSRQDPLR